VLLLQGPAGPFFKHLQQVFEANHFAVKRVLFHRADQLFAARHNIYRFAGDDKAWAKWLCAEFIKNRPDIIIMFGCSRPAHTIARNLACEFGITVISLEEGYLRAGYITCEVGGNNQHSPLRYWNPAETRGSQQHPLAVPSSFFTMCFWQAIYYLWRELTASTMEQTLYHRKIDGVIRETGAWMQHTWRRLRAKFTERHKRTKLLRECAGRYLLVPLQAPQDAQIQTAAQGWTNEQLIKDTLQSLAETPAIGDAPQYLVFKTHPLDENSSYLVSLIRREALALQVYRRVMVLESGRVGELAQMAAGMIAINSTSVFSALHYRIPVLVLGDAVFRHHAVVTVGENRQSIKQFLIHRASKRSDDISAFVEAVKTHALLPGDFYARKTQHTTAHYVVKKVDALLQFDRRKSPAVALRQSKQE